MAAFQRFASDNLHLAEVDPADFRVAVSIIDGSANLRSGDALHLAIARRLGAALMTLDRHQAEAASGAGVKLA
jgi:predicted nucleic acid-binding protein